MTFAGEQASGVDDQARTGQVVTRRLAVRDAGKLIERMKLEKEAIVFSLDDVRTRTGWPPTPQEQDRMIERSKDDRTRADVVVEGGEKSLAMVSKILTRASVTAARSIRVRSTASVVEVSILRNSLR